MLDFKLFHFPEIDSTNAEAKRNIAEYPHGSVIYADSQSAGKGRLNRNWISPPHKNLYLSVVLKETDLGYESLNSCVQVAALAIWQTLVDLGIHQARIKWPNDVLIQDKKISGILCESLLKQGQIEALIIGIGLNILMDQNDFSELDRAATSILLELHSTLSIDEILEKLLIQLNYYYQVFKKSPQELTENWLEASELKNSLVQFTTDQGQSIIGLMQGITPEGALIIENKDGIHSFYTGELKRL